MNRKKKVMLTIAMTLSMLTPVTAFADTVSGINFLNNTDKSSDYKLSDKQVSGYSSQIKTNSNIKEIFSEDNGRDVGDLSTQYSYLIEHNIVTREGEITANSNGVSVTHGKEELSSSIQKSDFLMGLYKAEFGVIPSRPVIFKVPAERTINGTKQQVITTDNYTPKGYKGTDTSFDFSNGDYDVYVSPNVHELYLSKLLDKGIISTKDLSNKDFVKQYKANGSKEGDKTVYASWDNKLPPYSPMTGNYSTGDKIYPASPLGYSWDITGYRPGDNVPMQTFQATRRMPAFFTNENIRTIDALKYIEKVLRLKEKDLTETEAKIVAYKYGTSYLLKLNPDVRKTVLYLIAMGVINFENPVEYGNLYGTLDKNYAYTLLYRVANKAGRVDFSKIQLTDSDNFWMDKGFLQQNFTVVREGNIPPQPVTLSVDKTEDKRQASLGFALLDMIGLTPQFSGVKYKAGDNNYTVTKEFFNPGDIGYKGTALTNLKDSSDVKIKQKGNPMVIEFKISAPSKSQAIAAIDSYLTIQQNANQNTTMQTVTKVDGEGQNITYISGDALKSNFSELVALNDKTLKNKVTGATAMLLQDEHMAMVGNTVIRSDDNMVMTINKVQYYNLAMVLKLMTNAYISTIDKAKIYVDTSMPKEIIAPVVAEGGVIEHVPVYNPGAVSGVSATTGGVTMYNQNLLTRGVTTLIRDFDVKSGGKTVPVKMIVDWSYSMPKGNSELRDVSNPNKFSVKNASKFLFNAPSTGDLRVWWDDNIGISNGLANMMYGTSGINYIKSGYLMPNITVLMQSDKDISSDVKKQIFNEIQLDGSYSKQFCGGDANNWYNALFNKTGNALNAKRRLRFITGKKEGNFWNFEGRYITTDYGTTYRAVNDDNRLSWDGSNIVINGRTSSSNGTYGIGKVITLNGDKFFVDGFGGGGLYYRLVSINPVSGKAEKISGPQKWTVKSGGYNVVEGKIAEYQKHLASGSYLKTSDYKDNPECMLLPKQFLKDGNYVNHNKISKIGNLNKVPISVTDVADSDAEGKDVSAFPVIYVNRLKYAVEGDKLIRKNTDPFKEQGNIFFSGLNSSMISALMDKAIHAIPFSKLPEGAQVIIQDTNYTKLGNSLCSDPIKNRTLTNNLVASIGNSKKSRQSCILQLYSGLNINCSGRLIPFSSYVKNADWGPLLDKGKGDKTIYVDNSNLMYASDKSHRQNYTSSVVPSSSCIKITMSDAKDGPQLDFIELDAQKKIYTLKYSTDKYSNGYIDDVSMFHDTLSLGIQDDLYLRLDKVKFHPLEDAQNFINKFKDAYSNALTGDFKALLKMIFTTVLSYLIVISWVCYAITKYGLGREFFMILKDPLRTSDRRGVDVIQLASLGMYNLDDQEPHLYRLFISNLMMFVLLYVVLYVV